MAKKTPKLTLVPSPKRTPLLPHCVSDSVDAVLQDQQQTLYQAHGLLSCAMAKVLQEMNEGDERFSIQHALEIAMDMIYDVASSTEAIALMQAAEAIDAARVDGGAA